MGGGPAGDFMFVRRARRVRLMTTVMIFQNIIITCRTRRLPLEKTKKKKNKKPIKNGNENHRVFSSRERGRTSVLNYTHVETSDERAVKKRLARTKKTPCTSHTIPLVSLPERRRRRTELISAVYAENSSPVVCCLRRTYVPVVRALGTHQTTNLITPYTS